MFLKPSFRLTSLLMSCLFLLLVSRTFGQSLSETWNVPGYQSSDYSEFYGQVYFSNTMEEWDYRVEQVLTTSINQWLENADRMVDLLLSKENGEDAFISNAGYLDERMRSLYSEVSVLYSEWERALTEDYFGNRNAFLSKLETGKVDLIYFQRIGQESLYEEYTEEERTLSENRNRILESATKWEFEWNQTKQEGLDSFATAFSDLQSDYDDYILSLQETEFRFSENLNAINTYKETIKSALSGMVNQLKNGMDSSCEVQFGCQYRNFDGSYNEAGKIFSKFINDLSDELNESAIDPDSLLTSISTKIRNFLSDESNKAFAEHSLFQSRVYTYQTGFQINLNQSTSSFDLGFAEWRLRNQSYYDLSSDMKYENWLKGGMGEIGSFSNVQDSEMRGIFQSIHAGDYGRLTSIINSKLGEGRRVQSLVTANLYTDAFHFINNDKIAGFYVPFEEARHTQGNLMLDGHNKYGYWIADRYITILTPGSHSFQMGAIGYSVIYEMYDDTSSKTSLYWKENSTQLGGQYRYFQDTLLPAVSHWESKVKDYSDTYEDWKDNRAHLISEATAKLESNRIELEQSKEEWLRRLEEEKREGIRTWSNLYETGDKKEIDAPFVNSKAPILAQVEFDRSKLSEYQTLASSKDISISLQVGGVGILEEFQRTIIGVNQYASVIQTNFELEEFQRSEQQKLINQMTYGINWESFDAYKNTQGGNQIALRYDFALLSKAEQSLVISCYENPTADKCKSVLKKEFEASVNSETGVLTLKKEIHSGMLGVRDEKGEYTAAKTEEVRHIKLSALEKVHSPNEKGFFTVWADEDWESLYQSKSNAIENFLNNSLLKDKTSISSNINSIIETDNRNQELYASRKFEKENADSLFQELALAYFTGGAAGVRAALKAKVEDKINTELAKAWITATGGSQDDIQKVSMVMDFMRGRLEIQNKKSKSTVVSVDNPITLLNPIEQTKLLVDSSKALLQQTKKAFISSMDFLNNSTGGVFGAVMNTFVMLPTTIIGNAVLGKDKMDALLAQKNAQANRIKEIKANEVSLVKSAASTAIAAATGLPLEMVSAGVSDFASSRDSKKARKAIEKNPVVNAMTNVYGVAGGIAKSALVAVGYKESELQHVLLQANQMGSSTNLNPSSAELASLGLVEKSFTMSASGTSFQSQLLNIKDKNRVVEELGKRALADQMAAALGINKSIAKGFIDKGYGDYKTRESDKNAKAKAIEQTAITAVSVLITLGASSAVTAADATVKSGVAATNAAATTAAATTTTTSFVTSVGNALKAVGQSVTNLLGVTTNAKNTIQIGEAIANATVQGIAGSKNGPDGVMAGIGNDLLGSAMKSDLLKGFKDAYIGGMTPGLGISYTRENGWGGMIGIGDTTSNANVSFSRRGDTTVQGSYNLGKSGFQLAGDMTTNGASNFGFNYNPTGEGTRKDWNYSLKYDFAGTGFSASVGYTDPESTLGLTSTFNREGMSSSLELTGVSIATNGPNGFQLDEINFSEQNINTAQDKTSNDQQANHSSENGRQEQEADFSRDLSEAGKALTRLLVGGTSIFVGLFGGSSTDGRGRSTSPFPNSGESVVLERDRKKDEEEDNDRSESLDVDRTSEPLGTDFANSNTLDPMDPNSIHDNNIQDQVGGVENPVSEFTSDGQTIPGSQDTVPSSDEFQNDVDAGAANRSLIYDPSTDTYVPISGIGRSYTADELANLHQADVQAGRQYKTGDGVQRGIFSSIGSFFGNDSTNSSGDSNAQKSDTNHREKNKFGEVVFTKDQVDTFNKKDKINIYGSDFVKQNINGTDYFVREKNGELQALILREDGRIMETSFQINRSIFGTSYSNAKIKLFDAVGKEITSSNSGHYNPNISAADALANFDKIEAIKNSLLDNFSKDTRLTSEKKLLELRLLGADTTDLESVLTKKRGKDVPLGGAALVEFEEYKRIREKKPLWDEPAAGYKTSIDALASVNLAHDKTKETNAEYFQRLGNEIREASKAVDLSDQKKLNEHLARVGELLGDKMDGKMTYAREGADGEISSVNTVGSDGFKQIDSTDCIRWIGGVFSAAGYTSFGSFANLNTNTFFSPEDSKRMSELILSKQAQGNGVEYLRQATNLLERTSPLIMKDVNFDKNQKDFKVPDLKIGQIGITRELTADGMKSDHAYIIVDKRFNESTKQFEYKISESYGGHGPDSRWIKHPDNDYLMRSEFYEVKPLDQK